MTTPPLPNILTGAKKLPQGRFHYEAMASYQGISYADVFTQFGKLLEGVEVVGYSTAGVCAGCFVVMFRLPTGEECFFHYTETFWANIQDMRNDGVDISKIFTSRRQRRE